MIQDAIGRLLAEIELEDEATAGDPKFVLVKVSDLRTLLTAHDMQYEQLVETQMLASKWMEAHDKLHAGKPYEFPKPADLPNRIKELEALLTGDEVVERVARAMQRARDEIGATEQQRIAFAYAEAAMRSELNAIGGG